MNRPVSGDAEQLTREQIERIRATFRMFGVGEEQRSRLSVLCDMALASLSASAPLSETEQSAPQPESEAVAFRDWWQTQAKSTFTFEEKSSYRSWCREAWNAALRADGGTANVVPDALMRRLKTLAEDFRNPCFGSAIHNDIPHTIGLAVLEWLTPSPSSQLQPSSTGNNGSSK